MSPDTFRIADQSDAPAIATLVNAAYRPRHGTGGWTHEHNLVEGDRTSTTQVAALINKPESVILVGLQNAAITACVHIEKHGGHGQIGMLAVDPALQATGVGKHMLALAEQYALETFGAHTAEMLVLSSRHELMAFYLRRGYHKTGEIMDFPTTANVGTPKVPALKIDVLEKQLQVTNARS